MSGIIGTSGARSGIIGLLADLEVDSPTLSIDTANDRVGIGTTDPKQLLHVYQGDIRMNSPASANNYKSIEYDAKTHGTTISAAIKFNNQSNSGQAYYYDEPGNITFWSRPSTNESGSTLTQRMVIHSDGKVGIGTASPSSILEIVGASSPQLRIKDSTNNHIVGMQSYDTAANVGTISNTRFDIISNNSERITISADGNVGIGDTSPYANVSVRTTSDAQDDCDQDKYALFISNPANDDNEELGIGFRISTDQDADDKAGGAITFERTAGNSVGSLHFKTSPSIGHTDTRMTINSSGNVGIGASPLATHADKRSLTLGNTGFLACDTAVGASKMLLILQNAYLNTSGNWVRVYEDEAPLYQQYAGKHIFHTVGSASVGTNITWDERMVITNTGNVGINDSTPTEGRLVVKEAGTQPAIHIAHTGSGRAFELFNSTGGTGMYIEQNYVNYGLEVKNTTTSWGAVIHNNHTTGGYGLWVQAGNSTSNQSFKVTNHNNSADLLIVMGDGEIRIPSGPITMGPEETIRLGTRALSGYESGSTGNVAIGYEALHATLNDANNNVAIGTNALAAATTGNNGTVSGDNNVVIGTQNLPFLSSGYVNVVLGKDSGRSIYGGYYNICIGSYADASGNYGVALGKSITAATDRCVIGRSSNVATLDFTSSGTWSQSSDIRKKTDIQDCDLGLSFIDALRTTTFRFKPAEAYPEEWGDFEDELDDDGELVKRTYADMDTVKKRHGMIAQEVKDAVAAAGASDYFTGWSEDENGQQMLGYSDFVLPLIKAVQELSAKVTALEANA